MPETPQPRVLIVDDERDVAESLKLLFAAEGVDAQVQVRPQQVVSDIEAFAPHLVLCDLRMPGLDGKQVLANIQEQAFPPRVVMMSAYGSLDTARDALAWGADDYISKPIETADIKRLLADAMHKRGGRRDIPAMPAPAEARYGALIGRSPAMRNVFQIIDRVSGFPTTVLIRGDSGSGKELVAREVHRRSKRAQQPFVPVNCGAIPEQLLESELFGYKRGSFTGADQDRDGLICQAHGGTLFLDEIGDLPLLLQVKLLRVIQEGQVQPLGASKPVPVDVRWVTATLSDLESAVDAGRFRQDLYFRINVMQLDLPPLFRRREDLEILIADILHQLNERYDKGIVCLEADAFALMAVHNWPGNVRELENMLERAYILTDGDRITVEGLRGLLNPQNASLSGSVPRYESLSIKQETRRLEIELIQKALEQTDGNRTHAAKILEISHRALLYKLKEYGIG